MKEKKISIPLFSIQILLFLFVNWGGDQLVSRLNWMVWLDSVGTVLCAYLYGPWCGAMVGVSSNLLSHVLYGTPWFYALISAVIALIVGFAARKGMLHTLLDTMTQGAILAASVTALAVPLNMIFNGGSTGNRWGDAVIGFFTERGFPAWGALILGQLYVELLDKLLILLALFLALRLAALARRGAEAIRKERQKRKEIKVYTLVMLLAGPAMLSAFGAPPASARAEDTAGPDASYNDYVQTVYGANNGLPCGEANDIAMTGDGILWIGTYAGLYRYNGREFRWMDGFDSVRNVNCLYVDEEGRLWIGTNDNGLSIMIGDEIVNVIDQDRGLPANSVKSITQSADGYYYIGTAGSMQIMTLNSGLKQVSVLQEVTYADQVAADKTGRVAAVTNDGTLYLMRQGRILSSRRLTDGQAVFKSCAFTPEGDLLGATTGNQIYRFRVDQGTFDLAEVQECPGLSTIKSMYFMEDGEMFVCADNGIGFFGADGIYEPVNTNNFNNSIENMLVDYQGNLWFTSSRLGLLRLAPSDFRDIYGTVGMDSRVVNAIVQWNGIYYFGTDKGMDAVDAAGRSQVRNQVTDRFGAMRIRNMIVDGENHLWVCTYGNGLVEVLPDGTEYVYNQENGAFGNRARVVRQLSDGTILAAGDTGLSFIRNHQVEHTIDQSIRHISTMVLTITERPDGTVLVGTDGNGLAVIRGHDVTKMLTRADGLSSEVILRTVPDEVNGGVFIITSNGLCYMDAEEKIRHLDQFPYYNNYDIWVRENGDLFVLSSAGLYIVNREDLLSGEEDFSYDMLNARRGLTGSLTANAWTWFDGASGDLYLPCDNGVYVINTRNLSGGARVYRMSLRGIRAGGEDIRTERNITIRVPRQASRIEIQPEVINYTIQDPYVGYMLEGFDTEWTILPQNNLGSIVYTNLPTGEFTFRLAVMDSSRSEILAERTYAVSKEKELYDNGWFILYLLSVPMFTVFWVTWLLVKRHEKKIEAQLAEAERNVEMGRQTVLAIANAVDAKDERTSEHSKRVALYSAQIARAYGLDEETVRHIEWTARMHDIGKIGVRDAVLNKAGRLTDEEYAEMKAHTTRGAAILKDFTLVENVAEGAEFHHERYDGRGYPKGLKGEEIPLSARIIGVADAFDAMTANRVYRKQLDFGYVLGELEKNRGTQFDPQFVDILLQLIRNGDINLNEIYHVSPEELAAQAAQPQAEGGEEAARKAAEEEAAKLASEAEKKKADGEKPAEAAGRSEKKDAAGAKSPENKGGQG